MWWWWWCEWVFSAVLFFLEGIFRESGGHSGRGLPGSVTRVTFSVYFFSITYFIHRRFCFLCVCVSFSTFFYLYAAFNSFILIIFSLLCSLITNNIVSCFILLLSYNFTINYKFRPLRFPLVFNVFCFQSWYYHYSFLNQTTNGCFYFTCC